MMLKTWCASMPRSLRLGMILAGGLHLGLAVESGSPPPVTPLQSLPAKQAPAVVKDPVSTNVVATDVAANDMDALIAQFTPPGPPEQIAAITNAFEHGSVAQKERLLVGLGLAGMSNALPFIAGRAGDEDPVVALAALRACQDLGPSTVADLGLVRQALDSADQRVQIRASILLARLEDESSLQQIIGRLGSVPAPEAKATLNFLHAISGKDLGDSGQPWQAWLQAEVQATDAKMSAVVKNLTQSDPDLIILALKEGSLLRLRRSELVPSIVPLLGHANPDVARMAELCLQALGGPVAKGAYKSWQKDHPVSLAAVPALSVASVAMPATSAVAEHFKLSSGMQDFLVVSGLGFVFLTIVIVLGRPTKKALVSIDQATGGHMSRRYVAAKKKGIEVIAHSTRFMRRTGASSTKPKKEGPVPPALERKTPRPMG